MRRVAIIDGVKYPTSISADDANIIVTLNRGRRREIVMQPVAGGALVPLGSGGKSDEADAVLSPDQRWLAFESDESGRPEVYIQPFGRKGERLRVSTDGGGEAQWGPDGRALFFIDSAGMLIKAELQGDPLRVVRTTVLFRISSAGMMEFESLGLRHFAVGRDRILVRELPGGEDADPVAVLMRK
jgi:Tol biopolymer transport system component